MKFIQGKDRSQINLFPTALENAIPSNNSVRAIDSFVDSLDLASMGFKTNFPENGRPAYHPADLLKLYIYGYMNRIRSSRVLEKECYRNIEVMWLIKQLQPDHNTIANFRKDNPKAIKNVFRATVNLARNFNLIGGDIIAGDGTKMRAQNSKKNNYNQKKIKCHIAYIDHKLKEYNEALKAADGDNYKTAEIKQNINDQKKRKAKYNQIKKQLDNSNEEQISTTDPDSRHLIIRHMITEVAYNIQSTVDAKYCIPITYDVTNQNDRKAMGKMLKDTVETLGHNQFTALFDKGYHTGSEFKTAHNLGIKTLVAVPAIGRASQAPNPAFNAENFMYDTTLDTFTCPQKQTLKSNGKWYNTRNYRFKQYKTKACKNCPVRSHCTTAKHNGKIVQRSEFAAYIEKNAIAIQQNQALYKRRQAIVEHPFGTMKRQWGFDHILTKKRKAARKCRCWINVYCL